MSVRMTAPAILSFLHVRADVLTAPKPLPLCPPHLHNPLTSKCVDPTTTPSPCSWHPGAFWQGRQAAGCHLSTRSSPPCAQEGPAWHGQNEQVRVLQDSFGEHVCTAVLPARALSGPQALTDLYAAAVQPCFKVVISVSFRNANSCEFVLTILASPMRTERDVSPVSISKSLQKTQQ